MTITDTTTEETSQGLGRTERRRMLRQWREEGQGQSLKQWAQSHSYVGTAAQVWLERKKGS